MCVISKNEAKFCHRNTAILAPGSWIFLFLTIYYLLGWSVNKGKLFQNNQMENHKLSETWELSEQMPHAAKWRCQKLIEIPQTTEVASVCYRWVEKSIILLSLQLPKSSTCSLCRRNQYLFTSSSTQWAFEIHKIKSFEIVVLESDILILLVRPRYPLSREQSSLQSSLTY